MEPIQVGALGLSARDVRRLGDGVVTMAAGAPALSPESVHVNRPLTNLVAGYPNREYVADRCCPIVRVAHLSDSYFEHPARQMFQIVDSLLASPSANPNEVASALSQTTYGCKTYALQAPLPNQTQANQDAPLNSQEIVARKVRNVLNLSRERRVAVVLTTSGNYGTNTFALTAGNRFSDATSDPKVWIDQAIRQTRVRVNKLVIGQEAYLSLIRHPKIEAHVNARPSFSIPGAGVAQASPVRPNRQVLADLFELEETVVFEALYDSAADGATENLASVFTRDSCALICCTDTPNILETATFCYTFRHKGSDTASAQSAAGFNASTPIEFRVVPDFVMGGYGGVRVIGVHADDEKVIGAGACGCLITTCIT